jgi:hypothetical protein
MKANVSTLIDIPCFRCLFWEWKKDSHLYCNPNECQKLTEWLLKQVEKCEQNEDRLVILTTPPAEASEKHKP